MRISLVLSVFLAGIVAAPGLRADEEFYHPADCWLLNASPYRSQTDFRGVPPSLAEIHAWMSALAVKYTIPVEAIAGICYQESGVRQWDAPPSGQTRGFLVHNLGECKNAYSTGSISPGLPPPPGLGLMQLTSITATDPSIANHDPLQDITDWKYNLEAGVQVLNQKYEVASDNSDQNGADSNANPACITNKLALPDSL